MTDWLWWVVYVVAGYWVLSRILRDVGGVRRIRRDIVALRRDERIAVWKRAAEIVGRFAEGCPYVAVATVRHGPDPRSQAAHQHEDNSACLLSCSLYGEMLAELEKEYQAADDDPHLREPGYDRIE